MGGGGAAAQGCSLTVTLSWVSGSWFAIPDPVTQWLLQSVFPVGGDAGFAAAWGSLLVTDTQRPCDNSSSVIPEVTHCE